MKNNYELYSSNDFLEDKFFLQWIKYKTPKAEAFWNQWVVQEPANIDAMRAAKEQLELILSVKRLEPEETDMQQVWENITQSILQKRERIIPMLYRRRTWAVAASVLFVLGAGIMWFMLKSTSNLKVATGYGEVKSVALSDSSKITVNANSLISYPKRRRNGVPREVWLKGEAHFNVKHLNDGKSAVKDNERFIVHTDFVEIEVLGTVFNVKERRGEVQVSLESGIVKVKVKKDSTKQLVLQPGELAVYNQETKDLRKVVKDPAIDKAWIEKKMLTNNTSVSEIIHTLEDTYGYKVLLEDSSIGEKRIDGVIPIKNEDNLLFVLSQILNVDIEKKNSLLIFKDRE